jgi:flagellar protein FliO/FliZ
VELIDISRMFFGLLAVLAMIGLCALAARKAGLVSNGFAPGKRRLQLVETLAMDARRRLAIVRCDGKEHLILLGPATETLIDADIPARPLTDKPLPQAFPIADALTKFNRDRAEEQAA